MLEEEGICFSEINVPSLTLGKAIPNTDIPGNNFFHYGCSSFKIYETFG